MFECVTFPATTSEGDVFAFKITATSIQGTLDSDISGPFMLAGVPATPTNAPVSLDALTDGTQVTVQYDAITNNGGSTIISYELQMGSLSLNDFQSVNGEDPHSLALSFTVTRNIQKGKYYAFRYRAINSVGPSEWSPFGKVQAASVPQAPPTPEYVTADSTSITLSLLNTQDNGGSPITETKLYTDQGDRSAGLIYEVTPTYVAGVGYTISVFDDASALIPKTTYMFAYAVKNEIGWSEKSNPITVETSTKPSQLGKPTVDWTKSSKTSLFVEWDASTDTDATIEGYILSMDNGEGGPFTDVFSGYFESSTTSFLKAGLITGKKYRFRVRAIGFNEEGADGLIDSFYVCSAPSGFATPTVTSQGGTFIAINWRAPMDNGGCPILEYAVFRDTGSGDEIINEVLTSQDGSTIRGDPSRDTASIANFDTDDTDGTTDVGKRFRIRVTAYNIGGRSIDSGIASSVLASIPDTPIVGPVNDNSVTSSSRIRVTYGVTSPPGNGGSPILSYALEIDDGINGDFKKLVGFTPNSLLTTYIITSGIQKGFEYRLRYRVRNAVGWSGYSPISYIIAANSPDTPPRPTFSKFENVAGSDTLFINIHPSQGSGGSPITGYRLERYNTATNQFDNLSTISPSSMSYSTTSSDPIGTTYRFRVIAINAIDESSPSSEAVIAFGDVPPQPATIVASECKTSETSIYVKWTPVTTSWSVSGYVLNMDDGKLGDYSPVYIGTNRDDITAYTVSGLTTGLSYRFTVQAVNLNGYSLASIAVSLPACSAPSQPADPTRVSSGLTSMTVSWLPPDSDGGCTVTGYELWTDGAVIVTDSFGVTSVSTDTTFSLDAQTLSESPPFDSSSTGDWIKFRVTAINAAGSTTSRTVQYVLASTPGKPVDPTESSTETTAEQLVVQGTALSGTTDTGGTSITGYEFQVDDGGYGEFITVQGGEDDRSLSLKVFITEGISKGLTYRVRYRGVNAVGPGEWSDPIEVVASTTPAKPDAPIVTSVDADHVTLSFSPVSDNGGEVITAYELYVSNSSISITSFSVDATYDGSSMAYNFTTVTGGVTYGFKLRARNTNRGWSEFSEVTYAAAGGLPDQPSAPIHNLNGSNKTYVKMTWSEGTSSDIPVLGYRLSIDDRGNEEYEVIYNGYGKPNVLSYIHGPLDTGETYNFILEVLNFNGASAPSIATPVTVCVAPSNFNSLEKVSSSKTELDVAWEPPKDDGGCPIDSYTVYTYYSNGTAHSSVQISSTNVWQVITVVDGEDESYRVEIKAENENSFVNSNIITVVAATIPNTPTSAPAIVEADTDDTQITVSIAAITDTGGSAITSYELQKDNGRGGSYTTVGGGDLSPSLSLTYTVTTDIERGVAYRFRYRSRNIVGWSGWSSIGSLTASTIPDAPAQPTYLSSTDTTITLSFSRSTDDGGSLITGYELSVNNEIISDYDYATDVFTYTVSTSLTLTTTLTTGQVYQFAYRAVNSKGNSEWSKPTSVAFGPLPSTPSAPYRDTSGNSQNSIGVAWTALTSQTLPVLEYILYVDDGTSIDYKEIYRGSSTSFIYTGSNPAASYEFYVKARNYNGEGYLSPGISLISCVAPYSIYPPVLVSSTSNTARLKWSPPGSNGGCPVKEFRLLRDDGAGGSITTVVDDASFNDKPNLYEYSVDLTGFKGKRVRFRLQVTNQIGDSSSTSFITVLVAGLPVIPGPITINDDTSGTQLSFTIPTVTDDGGSFVNTYHVEMDDGQGGNWNTISGYPFDSLRTSFLITQGIRISYTYSVRYRVRNNIGWSDYSDITYILASEAPSTPTRPVFVESTSTTLIVKFGLSSSNGGSAISSYTYQIDKEDGSGFIDVATYTSLTAEVTFDIDGSDSAKLQPGQMYKFKSYATNEAGHISNSLERRVRAAAVPAQPSTGPTIVESISNTTSIGVSWDAVDNTYAYVSGYKLYRDNGNNGNFTLIYDGTNRPGQRTFISHNLTPGMYYRFKVLAVNYNGDGPESDESVIPACLPPSELDPPVLVSSTETLIKLSWSSPKNLNGCSLTGWKLYQDYAANFPLTSTDEVFASTLNTNPAIRSINIPFTNPADIGQDFIFQLFSINDAGAVSSGTIQVTLAAVPTTPSAGPTRIVDRTNSTHITIQILDQVGEPDLNGGTLKRVHVQVDNAGDGNYTDIIGPDDACIDTIFTISEGIAASKTYQFRYRIQNENGWSDYSPVTRITAASAPSSPPKPTLDSATDSQITLLFSRPDYNGGAPITSYQLYIND
jgi:hypothetical protein